ncbi:MAG TPA: DNA mismatch repair endonuclease MutL [Candidatus Deferrimicrobium sp.]|nr:DNA mismatch repair endonuclease MutL [Candidatus Deferrimicrobium sp.]
MTDKTLIRRIKPLPIRVINKIAAGEVVERPASVVKELVENAIDAGADRVDIIVEKSGTKLIKVVDNGCGIDEDQIEIAFSRHATSKIASFEDLNSLSWYGFRGEALPSIASVSRLRMVSRTHQADAATEIIYEGGVLHSKEPVAAPVGTTVEVENLFFNTPARRKFMKSEATEARHMARTATALAIGRYDIGFSMTANGRPLFSLPRGSSLTDRVAGLLGKSEDFLTVTGEGAIIKIEGCIGLPSAAQSNRYGQFIFINGRYVQSPTLSHALAAGYGELLPRGMFPVGALLLAVDPAEIDVNVHPAKTEVRLSRERDVYDAIYHCVQQALRQETVIPAFKADAPVASRLEAPSSLNWTASGSNTSAVIPGVQRQDSDGNRILHDLYQKPALASEPSQRDMVTVDRRTGEVIKEELAVREKMIEPASLEPLRLVGRFFDLYLMFQSGDSIYVLDQHTAHERVLYENTLAMIERHQAHGQNLLFPVQVDLTPESWAVFEEAQQLLNESGFTVASFGGRLVRIEAIPSVLSKKPPDRVFRKILDDITSLKKAGYDMRKAIAQSLACRSAVMAGDRLSDEEAVQLVVQLMKCRDRFSCPHGRPTFIKISKGDLDKQFGRT